VSKLQDEEIVRKILDENNHELFGQLYDRYKERVFQKCISFSKNEDEAKDLLHDVFLKTFVNLSKFSGRSSFSTWLYSITYNYCVDYARKKAKVKFKDINEMYEISDFDDKANEENLLSIRAERLKRVLDEIDPRNKMILLMKFQDEFSIKKIMEVMDLSESAVKMRIKRAKASAVTKYRELFKED
jgi:RNA polymerase sigma-70 factor (ECF subfamily)